MKTKPAALGARDPREQNPTVDEILRTSDVWDMTLPWVPTYWDIEVLARYHRVGYSFVSATLQDWPPTFDGMRQCIQQFQEIATPHESWLMFGSSLADIEKGRREHKLVIGLNSQETRPIGEDLARVEALRMLGIRHMLLAYNVRNLVADGCAERSDAGLSNFGRQLVTEMGRVGMIVDCTHTGRQSTLEAIELSSHPTIFSHSNPYSLCPHIRNIHDEQIKACAASDGVIGIVGVGAFLGDVEAKTQSMFRHIDYVASLVGPEHVGLGTDFVDMFPVREEPVGADDDPPWPDPVNAWPDPTGTQIPVESSHCFRPEQLHELVHMMLDHGYPVGAVRGILGGNFRRVYATVE